MKTEKELKEEIKKYELIEDTFESDGVIYYKSKTYLKKLQAQLKILQERNAEVKQAIEESFPTSWLDSRLKDLILKKEYTPNDIEILVLEIKEELLQKLGLEGEE